jgi:uncharacterized DUF497 family protein
LLFDWDDNNRRKIRVHRLSMAEVEQAMSGEPIAVYEQDAAGEPRWVYYGETRRGRLLAIIVTERAQKIRVVTAYDLDAGQKQDYLNRRSQGE